MHILLALAYHNRATFETFRQLEPSTTEFFLLVKLVGGSITLCILTEATERFMYSFGSALKLVTDLNWRQAI